MRSLIILLAALSATSAFAVDGVYLGEPSYGGTGCPQGSASTSLSPDATSLSILFDQYVTEAGRSVPGNPRIARKSCNVSIPVHVPQGYSVSIFEVDYRGYNALPVGARSQFNVEYFFAGSQGPRYSKTFLGELNDDYLLSNTLQATAVVWSPCGADVNLRTNSSMMVQTNSRSDQAMSTVDSIDIRSGIRYMLQWRRCN